jgi:hypothetical protein
MVNSRVNLNSQRLETLKYSLVTCLELRKTADHFLGKESPLFSTYKVMKKLTDLKIKT